MALETNIMVNGDYAQLPIKWDKHRWPSFTRAEMACYHCGDLYHWPTFMDALQKARDLCGRPFRIHSAHRCSLHNARVGGAPLSQHLKLAVDIGLKGHDPRRLYQSCKTAGFRGFGFYSSFLHIDLGPKPGMVRKSESKEIMASILNFGADAAAGGLFGIFGTALGRVASYFERKQEFLQEEKRWGHELKLHELQMKAKKQETELELAIEAQKGSWRGLEASLAADAAIGVASKWVINTLRLVRPALTLLLWFITAWIFSRTQDGNIANSAVFAATAATLWWFGDRAPKPKPDYLSR